MSELTVSKYLNNVPASKRKRVYSRLLDYFSLFVVSYLFFTIFYSIGSTTPLVRGYNNDYTSSARKIMDYIDESRIQTYNEKKNNLVDANETAVIYLKNLTKTSAYVHNMQIPEYQDDGTYIMVDVNYEETFMKDKDLYPLDNLSYYYNIFKKTDTKLNNYVIGEVDYSDDIETYQYLKAMVINDETYHVTTDDPDYIARAEGISKYLVLTDEKTEKMINRVIKGEKIDDATNTLYNKLFNAYRRGVDFGREDIEKNSLTFAKLNAKFKNSYQNLTKASAIIYVLAYTFAYIVLNGVVCLISKECVTIGQKVMRLGLADKQDNNLVWWRILVYELLNYVLFFTSSIISFYFIGIFGVLSYEIFKGFTLFALLLGLFIFNLFSFGMILFSKQNNDLSTLASGIVIKDKNEFETSPEDDLINTSSETQEVNNSGE